MSTIITLGPVAYNPKGTYDQEIEYERLDVVLYNGVSYVAKQTVQGELPTNTTYWDALGISGADMSEYYTKVDVDGLLDNKYEKPDSGIPKTDLSSSVQTSLDKANSALQSETYTGTITSVKMNGSTISSSGEADLGTVITSHQDISGKEDKSIDIEIKLRTPIIDKEYEDDFRDSIRLVKIYPKFKFEE
jgi:hypothetical protein